jgi:hypothetical protein
VVCLNSSGRSRRITKTKLVRERLLMLQHVGRWISTDLATVPWLSLNKPSSLDLRSPMRA